jgi:hypothetical protein
MSDTVYILKNHNGKVLARHTDVKKLADEMLKYEAQTGNRTLIEVLEPPTRRASLRVPPGALTLAKEFMTAYGLKGTPEVDYTPTAITFVFPNWNGTVRDLAEAIAERTMRGHNNFEDLLREALDIEEYVIGDNPKFSVRGTDAVVVFPMRPYDPDEDSPF